MNKPRFSMLLTCVLPFLAACQGTPIANVAAPVDLTPPEEFRYVAPAGSYKGDLSALVGTFAVYDKTDNSIQVLEQTANPYDPRLHPVVETVNQTLYSSLVDGSIPVSVPVISAALKDAGGVPLEVKITDVAHAQVPTYSVDILRHIGARYHPLNANQEIVYVSEAWLRRFSAATLTPLDVPYWTPNAAGVVVYDQPATVVYNNVPYTKDNAFKDDYYLTVSIVPYSKIVSTAPGAPLEALPASAVASVKPQMLHPGEYTWWNRDWHHRGYGYGYGGYGYREPMAKKK